MHDTATVEAIEHSADAAVPLRLPLSVCVMTRGGTERLARMLELLRPLATEVVVALDDRAEDQAARLASVADEIVLFPHRDPGDSLIPWLHNQCHGRWILNLDDDEVPSRALLARLPDLLDSTDATHWWLPRRWLIDGVESVLDEAPWVPDYQLRLYRNDPRTLRFSDAFHRPVIVSGPGGFARDPLWHLDCVLNSFDVRLDKAQRYERARRGMRVAGVAHNTGFYVPELLPGKRTAPVPRADVRLIRSVLAESVSEPGPERASVRRASRHEIDALWPGPPFDPGMWDGQLTSLERLDGLPAGARHTIAVAVENRSRANWLRGPDAAPLVQVACRWLDADGSEIGAGIHTPLPLDVTPGQTVDVPVHICAPELPGRYRLSIDLVHEHVRWFGCTLEWPVDVRSADRVALIGQGELLERALDQVNVRPDIEPLILEVGATITPERYERERVPGLGDYLLAGIHGRLGPVELTRLGARTAKLLRRARRLRLGKAARPLPHGAEDCLAALAGCQRLVIACADWEPGAAPTRNLWRLAATVAAARTLGLAVEVERGAIDAAGPLDRLLAQLVRRGAPRRATALG